MADVRDGGEEEEVARRDRQSSRRPRPSAGPGKEVVLRPGSAEGREAGRSSVETCPRTRPNETKTSKNPLPQKREDEQRERQKDGKDRRKGSRSRDKKSEIPCQERQPRDPSRKESNSSGRQWRSQDEEWHRQNFDEDNQESWEPGRGNGHQDSYKEAKPRSHRQWQQPPWKRTDVREDYWRK
eukprot:11780994-Heterocapsa_arctica.AAC.1